jgi:major membrane immunogen (membrane-anchored lipoprotein)
MKNPTKILLAFALAIAANIVLVACGNSDDGAMLSDDEKIKMANKGRQDQMGQQGGANPAPGAPAAPAAGN